MHKMKLAVIGQSLLIIVLLCAVVGLLIRLHNAAIPKQLEEPVSITEVQVMPTEVIYETTGEKIFLQEGGYGQIWLPVLANVPKCSHDLEKLVRRNGRMYYVEDHHITSAVGVDVSSHQKEIDWEKVKASGVEFAMIRCGFRGYGSGKLAVDTCFDQNLEGALNAGLDVGIYFYSQAITPEEAEEEAEMTIRLIGDAPLTYPVVYDWETVSEDQARTDGISVDTLTDCSVAFCRKIEAAGFTPMVYQNKRTALLKLDLPRLTDYDFWLAEYGSETTYYYDYRMWQYCSDGRVPGITGDVDLNICFAPYRNEPQETTGDE